jgi:hypothetical protein
VLTIADTQILGVNWMCKQEMDPKRVHCKGGILGDEVGLGKVRRADVSASAQDRPSKPWR